MHSYAHSDLRINVVFNQVEQWLLILDYVSLQWIHKQQGRETHTHSQADVWTVLVKASQANICQYGDINLLFSSNPKLQQEWHVVEKQQARSKEFFSCCLFSWLLCFRGACSRFYVLVVNNSVVWDNENNSLKQKCCHGVGEELKSMEFYVTCN